MSTTSTSASPTLGFEYGPAFQGLTAAWRDGDDSTPRSPCPRSRPHGDAASACTRRCSTPPCTRSPSAAPRGGRRGHSPALRLERGLAGGRRGERPARHAHPPARSASAWRSPTSPARPLAPRSARWPCAPSIPPQLGARPRGRRRPAGARAGTGGPAGAATAEPARARAARGRLRRIAPPRQRASRRSAQRPGLAGRRASRRRLAILTRGAVRDRRRRRRHDPALAAALGPAALRPDRAPRPLRA